MSKLEKLSSPLAGQFQPLLAELKQTISYAQIAGVSKQIFFYPMMFGSHHNHFKGGVLVEVVRKGKRMDILAVAGR